MPSPITDELRRRDVDRKRVERAGVRTVEIPPCKNRKRRQRLERDDNAWLRWYFGVHDSCRDPFSYEFTEQQIAMIAAIRNAIIYGGDQALAASRGEGKTTIFERMILKYTLAGTISFSVLFASTGSLAQDSLDSIKMAIEENDRLLDDYPEVCTPVRALENTPNRAHYQMVSGAWHSDRRKKYKEHPSRFKWCGQEIVLPNVPGSPACGAIIATRGLDSAVRGLKKRGKRPDVAGIDDPDTEESVRSEEQAKKLEDRIDRAIAGLGGQKRAIARVMLTTIQNRTCVSYRFTDPKEKPTWKGRRFRFLVSPPSRPEMWEEYVAMRKEDMRQDDEFGRRAHQFYLENRAKMDDGAVVANPNRFDGQILEDGTHLEVSALQRYYNEVARIGPEAVAAEFDNDPPEESGPIESGITAYRIQTQTSGYAMRTVPPGCTVLTQGIDVGKMSLHWVVRAWRPDATGYVIEYGVQDVHGTIAGSDEGVDVAVKRAIHARMDATLTSEYRTLEGEVVPVDLTLVDSGWRTEAVYHACRIVGQDKLRPAKGIGKSNGAARGTFRCPLRSSADKKPGDGWCLSRQSGGLWLVDMDTDRWKAWEHDRWMTPTDKPGTLFMWGEGSGDSHRLSADEKAHFRYAAHIVSEVEVEEVVKGALRRQWKVKRGNNHWLDASYMSCVAANMCGIKLMRSEPSQPKGSWYAQPTGKPPQAAGVPHIPGVPKSAVEADGWVSS